MNKYFVLILGIVLALTSCGPRETWDYVTLGDSFFAGSSIPEQYATFIEEDVGVEVVLHEKAVSGQEPAILLENLRTDEELRQLIRDAEVITFDFSASWGNSPELKYLLDTCKGDDNQQCLRDALEQAKADWTEMADIITELTAGRPVLVSVFTFGDWIYDGYYKDKITSEQKAVMSSYFMEFQEFQQADAVARGMRVFHVFPPDVSSPPPAEYFQSDGFHLSEKGSKIVAEMLSELGYEFVVLK